MKFCNTSLKAAIFLGFLCTEATALSTLADAQEPVKARTFTCEIVRSYVARHGEDAAEKWAKKNKWPKERIAEARACLRR